MHSRIAHLLATGLTAVLVAGCGSQPAPTPSAGGPSATGTTAPSVTAVPSASNGSPSVSGPLPSATNPLPSGSPEAQTASHPFGFAAKGLSHEVMAFVTSGYVAREAAKLDYAAISTVVEFGIQVQSNGALARTLAGAIHPKWKAWTSPAMDDLIARAHAAGTKVVPSIIGYAWTPAEIATTRALLASPTARARMISETVAEVVRRGVDGVNLDFEPIPVGQRTNFTALVRGLRAALDAVHPGYQLTVAMTGYFSSYDPGALIAPGAADAIYLMGYHYRGTFSTQAGSNSPLGGTKYNLADTVSALATAGVPADRIILGLPFYGHLWPTVGPTINARVSGPGRDILYAEGITLDAAHAATYDPVEDVMWGAYQARSCSTCALTWWQFYVDNATTLARKWAWIADHGLLGTGVWAAGYEGAHPEPWQALRTAFLTTPTGSSPPP
ncbi:MAG: glycosyl hydrolase family 18 protein [Candidatus Limnocylindrales bacterium]